MKRRLTVLAALIGAGLFLQPAFATPPIERAFGNTIQSTYPDGRQAELWLQPGGAYQAKGRRGQDTSGRWSVSGQRLCLRQLRPFFAPIHYCTPIPVSMAGAWNARAPTGERVSVALVVGHVVGRKGPPARGNAR